MQSTDVAQALEKQLTASDLRASGAALYRKIVARIPGTSMRGYAIKRIGHDLLIVLVSTGEDDYFGSPYFLWRRGTAVHTLVLPSGGLGGTYFAPWKQVRSRIVGVLGLVQGNTSYPCAVILDQANGDWKITDTRESKGQFSGARFIGPGMGHLRISTRSYEFRAISQPHAGPLLIRESDWYILGSRIAVRRSWLKQTPLYDLDRFVEAVRSNDSTVARRYCEPRLFAEARSIVAALEREQPTVTCPYSYQIDESPKLGFYNVEGETKSFFVLRFLNGCWRIAQIRHLESFPKPKD